MVAAPEDPGVLVALALELFQLDRQDAAEAHRHYHVWTLSRANAL